MSAVDPRIDAILEVLLAFARHDFTHKAPIGESRDSIDAIAAGLNMLAEELHGEVASRRELEAAYRSMKEAQARLLHGGKLVAIGQLASSVAHEISNPATWVLASLDALERDLATARATLDDKALTEDERRRRLTALIGALAGSVRDASSGMERVVGVTRDLRRFSRADDDEIELVPLAEVVRASCKLATPLLRQCVSVDLVLDDGVVARGRRGQLGQVVTNLLVNAAQAVAASNAERRVRVELSTQCARVTLAVDDSGPGVPVDLRQRIFEPFFTTKGVDEGTGLGLSVVAEIVHRHGGEVRVIDSELGGARFEVQLPATS